MFALVVAFSLFNAPVAYAEELLGSHSLEPGYFDQVRGLLLRCAVQPYAIAPRGHRINGNLRSVCGAELVVTGASARFDLGGKTYVAHLYDAVYSDEGDLNDVRVIDSTGREVATRTNILSYGDVLLALAGGNDDFREVYDSSLLE